MAINVPNVVLRNATIKGNLLLGEGIGEGDVTLDRVVVKGTTTVRGGGKNSVHVLDSALSRIVITSPGNDSLLVARCVAERSIPQRRWEFTLATNS